MSNSNFKELVFRELNADEYLAYAGCEETPEQKAKIAHFDFEGYGYIALYDTQSFHIERMHSKDVYDHKCTDPGIDWDYEESESFAKIATPNMIHKLFESLEEVMDM